MMHLMQKFSREKERRSSAKGEGSFGSELSCPVLSPWAQRTAHVRRVRTTSGDAATKAIMRLETGRGLAGRCKANAAECNSLRRRWRLKWKWKGFFEKGQDVREIRGERREKIRG
jgi:hypothetical protein